METETTKLLDTAPPAESVTAEPPELFHASPIHLQPSGEELFEGGFVGGLHLGPAGDRLPGADPLYDGSLQAKVHPGPVATKTE